jgi:hypothetical protein
MAKEVQQMIDFEALEPKPDPSKELPENERPWHLNRHFKGPNLFLDFQRAERREDVISALKEGEKS